MIEKWLAFDVGTTGTKAALIDEKGRIEKSASREYGTYTGDKGTMEQNATDWWQAVVDTTHELNPASDAQAIVITGQMQDMIPVDAKNNPIHRVVLYNDTRAQSEAEEVLSTIGQAVLVAITGNDQDASGLLAKLLWLSRHKSAVYGATKHLLLGAADFIAFQMTGQSFTDTTTASTTGLMELRSRQRIHADYFRQLELEAAMNWIPEFVPGGSQVGKLSLSAANELNLEMGIPVYLAPGDAGAATIGAGCGDVGSAYAYLGTSGWIAFTERAPANPEKGVITLAHPRPDLFIQVAPLMTAGGNLEWIRDLFEADTYDEFVSTSLKIRPTDLLYLPYLNGERAPIRDAQARGAFIGLDIQTSKLMMFRAVLEGVVFAYRHALEALMSVPPTSLTITGGGTRSRAWCQLFADILNMPIAIAGDAENVGLRGAVLTAQITRGEQTSYQPDNYFPVDETLQPNTQYREQYDKQYQRFREAYPALKPIFQTAN